MSDPKGHLFAEIFHKDARPKYISIPDIELMPFTWEDYFMKRMVMELAMPRLKPLKRPCGDCAVKCGLYTEISDALARQPEDMQKMISATWFCHNHPNRACAGNIENLKRLNDENER